MKKCVTTLVLLLSLISYGQKNQSIDGDRQRLEKICDTFMQTFSKGEFKEAIDLLRSNSVIESGKMDTLLGTIESHAVNAFPLYGKILAPEFIGERKVKGFIVKRYYILKFEKYPIKFEFTLYNSGNGWTITSFEYNDELIEILE